MVETAKPRQVGFTIDSRFTLSVYDDQILADDHIPCTRISGRGARTIGTVKVVAAEVWTDRVRVSLDGINSSRAHPFRTSGPLRMTTARPVDRAREVINLVSCFVDGQLSLREPRIKAITVAPGGIDRMASRIDRRSALSEPVLTRRTGRMIVGTVVMTDGESNPVVITDGAAVVDVVGVADGVDTGDAGGVGVNSTLTSR